jgi:hypothetical protein
MANSTDTKFTGLWHSSYWFPSNDIIGEEVSEYDMKVHQNGDELIFESLPNEEKSYMFIKLKLEDGIAIGTWHESTSPTGAFKGAQYNGAGQLVVDLGGTILEGKWAGAGYDHKLEEMRIYSGNWEIRRLADS